MRLSIRTVSISGMSSVDETENLCRHIYKNCINLRACTYCLTSQHIATFDTAKVDIAVSGSGHRSVQPRAGHAIARGFGPVA